MALGSESVSSTSSSNYREDDGEDRISRLPDEILTDHIISRLTINEAARTSVLSGRWRSLWTHFTGTLDFNGDWINRDLWDNHCPGRTDNGRKYSFEAHFPSERPKFINWVNRALQSIHADTPTIRELRICFDLIGSDFQPIVDGWLDFAIQKRVQRLHLDFSNGYKIAQRDRYLFPSRLLFSASSFTVLNLKYVDVTGELLEDLLFNRCPSLQVLRVSDSNSLVSLKLSGSPPLKLKELELCRCERLQNLEISPVTAANLVLFGFDFSFDLGRDCKVPFKDVPVLPSIAQFSLAGYYHQPVLKTLHQFSASLLKIQSLQLYLPNLTRDSFIPGDVPVLSNVKHLELSTFLDHESYLFCTSFLKACPLLQQLTLKVGHVQGRCKSSTPTKLQHVTVTEKNPYQCLKVLKYAGFTGHIVDHMVIMYFVENAFMLKKIIIDPLVPSLLGDPQEYKLRKTEEHQLRRKQAVELGGEIPGGIELEVV